MSATAEYRLCVLFDGELRAAAKLFRQAIDIGHDAAATDETKRQAAHDAMLAAYRALYHLIMADDPDNLVLVVGHVPSPAAPQKEGR